MLPNRGNCPGGTGAVPGKWDVKYPKIYKSWHDSWAALATYFKYPEAVRRPIYTANAIEGFNCQLRKVAKSKTVFLTDDSLLKMLYLAMMDITKKWQATVRTGAGPFPAGDLF